MTTCETLRGLVETDSFVRRAGLRQFGCRGHVYGLQMPRKMSEEGTRRRWLHGARLSQIAARGVLGREKNEMLWAGCRVRVHAYLWARMCVRICVLPPFKRKEKN